MSSAQAAGNQTYPAANTTGGQISVTIPTSADARVRARRLYRTRAGGSTVFLLATIGDNSTTTYLDSLPDTALGEEPPASNATGHSVNLTSVPTVNDNSATTFTDKKSDDQLGQPSPVFGVLTGVPASSTGSIARDLESGDTVRLYVQRDDAAAQTALAALEGGDGIREAVIDVGDEIAVAELTAAADAELAAYAAALTSVRFRSRDVSLRSGKTITLDLGAPTNLAGDFLIQRVISTEFEISDELNPMRDVIAASSLLVTLSLRTFCRAMSLLEQI